jgi:hypothetical protein
VAAGPGWLTPAGEATLGWPNLLHHRAGERLSCSDRLSIGK